MRSPIMPRLCLIVLLALVGAFAWRGSSVAATLIPPVGTAPSSLCWQVVPSPNVGSGGNTLQAVATVTANDVWAVGSFVSGNIDQTLIQHWDGIAWAVVPSPNVGTGSNLLYGASVVSTADIWAVGFSSGANGFQTLIEHWDGTNWTVVPSPNGGSSNNNLSGVVALATDNVWVVGGYYSNGVEHTLTEHWGGTQWTIVPSPTPTGSPGGNFYGVAAVDPSDIWAVGSGAGPFGSTSLTEHWNGVGWTIIPNPNPGQANTRLYGVTAASSSDVWATGLVDGDTLIEHWNGTSWAVVSSPNVGSSSQLYKVVAVAPNDVWSVGFGADAISGGNLTLTEHWDGTNWLVVSSPNAGSSSRLRGVAAVAADDVWAVESYSTNGSGSPQTLIEHYALCPASTATLTVTTTPPTATATRTNTPSSTATAPPSNTATGTPSRTVTTTPTNTVLPTVTPTVTITPTLAATATSTMTASATATVNNTTTRTVTAMPTITPTPTRTVTGTATPVASSTPTGTAMAAHTITATNTLTRSPAITGTATNPPIVTATVAPTQTAPALSTATATVLPASATALPATATASATACVLPFSDVPPSYYAYGYITWLYCRGAITGYSDGTFRPEATVTRGQTAKIVLLGAGLGVQIPAGAPHFSDVLPSNVFYGFVETAFGRGIVTGYSDGTFRPSAAVTRGQIAKIVVGARGLSLLSPPSPTFADVAATDVFYPFVETAAAHGIVGGYTCGGTGEPCDGGHRPYYRPGANATRAQLSKLVYLAFVGP